MDYMSFCVSQNLHHLATTNIFHAPMSFFDTTPLGRVLGIFGKDIDSAQSRVLYRPWNSF
jgi:ATP-binding cassette subfamily C (CFTR/MRP) protein 1